jgi:hypothetical protein
MAKKQAQKKIFTIPGHKGNANQNQIKIPPNSCQKSYHQEHKQHRMLVRMQGKIYPHTMLVEM